MTAPRIVYVRWVDSCIEGAQLKAREMGDVMEMHSVGFLVRETDQSVTVAQDYLPDERGDEWRSVEHITRATILEMRDVHAPHLAEVPA